MNGTDRPLVVAAEVEVRDEGGLAACGAMQVPESERPERANTTLDQRGVVEPARQRKIIHIDMDAFYASVEQRDDPALRGKPVAVGGSGERGVVAAASYEARRFGVRSAMPSVTAKRKCSELIFVKPRFDVYRAVSQQIRAIFAAYTPVVEPLSLDEAYLDVTENLKAMSSATEIAEQIRARIRSETELTASAGVSYNKFLAKMASDERKPDGLFVITPRMGPAFVENLPVGRFHGIGPATRAKMERLGIRNGSDLKAQTLLFLRQQFGKAGLYYYTAARGIDERPVCAGRIRKSIGAETTFNTDIFAFDEAWVVLGPLIAKVWAYCEESSIRGRTVTLKAKYADFQQVTRSRTGEAVIATQAAIEAIVYALLESFFPVSKGIRLLGVTLSSLSAETGGEHQLRLPI
ncbi:MAG: DNA polymerase IV [Isosphaeraceae bacterium]|nr:DNA polymerase IV [Isosphaeraceae bacterium]